MKLSKVFLAILFFILSFLTLPSSAFAQAASLSLSPATGTFNKGCDFSLKIELNTGGAQTDGTDAILLYDSSRVTAKSIISGSIYSDYPGNSIRDDLGKITVSGLASVSSAFSGAGTLATVNFTVKDNAQTGATQIKFDFDANDRAKTTDSNVVQRGTVTDILNTVNNGNYTIGTGTCLASPSPSPSGLAKGAPGVSTPSASFIPQPIEYKTLPDRGSAEFTATLAILGVSLTVLGILGLALL